jgi:hypothetical protein
MKNMASPDRVGPQGVHPAITPRSTGFKLHWSPATEQPTARPHLDRAAVRRLRIPAAPTSSGPLEEQPP